MELLILADAWELQQRVAVVPAAAAAAQEVPEPEELDPSQDWDYSEVSWDPGASEDEWARMQAAMGDGRVSVEGQSQPEPSGPPVPDVDFDREWI